MTTPSDRRAFLLAAPAVGAALALGAAGTAPAVAQTSTVGSDNPTLRAITRGTSVLVKIGRAHV